MCTCSGIDTAGAHADPATSYEFLHARSQEKSIIISPAYAKQTFPLPGRSPAGFQKPSSTRLLEMLPDRFGAFEARSLNQLCVP